MEIKRFDTLKSAVRKFMLSVMRPSLTDFDINYLREVLNKQEQILFYRQSVVDQKHAILTAYKLEDILGKRKGKQDKLIKAALLHDVGKVCVRLTTADRVWQTIFFKAIPPLANYLADRGADEHTGRLRRVLYCYKYHPRLGAALIRDLGVDEGVVYLVEHHHDPVETIDVKELISLQMADLLS